MPRLAAVVARLLGPQQQQQQQQHQQQQHQFGSMTFGPWTLKNRIGFQHIALILGI